MTTNDATTRKLFLHRDGHLRTTLQILLAAGIFLCISSFGQGIIGDALFRMYNSGALPEAVFSNYFLTGILPEVFLNVLSAALILLLYRVLNKKPLATMGVPAVWRGVPQIFAGIFAFLLFLSSITAVLLATGNLQFTGVQFHLSILQYLLQMASVSLVEEVLNRGYILHLVKSRASAVPGVLISALVFMLFHLRNPGISPLALFNIFLAGVGFAVLTCKTGNVWFAFGAHIVWNVGCACVFGLMSVSETVGSILNFTYTQQTLFNGYGSSPLNGLIGTAAWLVLIAVCLLWPSRKKAAATPATQESAAV